MKNLYRIGFMLVLTGLMSFVIQSAKAQTIHKDYLDGHIWFKVTNDFVFKSSIDAETGKKEDLMNLPVNFYPQFESLFSEAGVTEFSQPFHMVEDAKLKHVFRVEFSNYAKVDELIKSLELFDYVEYAEPIPLSKHCLTPNDPDFNSSDQWGLFQINAESAWNVGTGSSNVVVAIVDDAVEITHNDLASVIWTNSGEVAGNGQDDDGNGYVDDVNGYDVADSDNDPNPDSPVSSYDHGTHVAGIAGAATNNNTGMASIGFGVSLMAVKSTNSASAVTDGYAGIIYAAESGADVINMSWGGSGSSQTAQNVIDYAHNQNIVLIAAAGNDNVNSTFYPAGYTHVISVASTTFGDSKSSFSNYGNWIDISAPGSAIWSTVPNNGYAIKQGTSMASPMVAGLAGLLLSLNPSLPPSDVESCILNTADDIDAANPGYVGELGSGRINALAAMNCISATLNLPPQADFSASLTNILEGQSVDFTDLSTYNPTSWSWTFTGGTPSTYNGQTPPTITYNTAGTYPVELTVTNSNGSDTETKTGYITVNALTGCDTISNTIPGDPNTTWTWGAPNGYIGGHNYIHPRYICDKYSGLGPTNIMGANFYFTQGETNDPNAFITITVWEDNAGEPGNIVYTEDLLIDVIEANVTGPGPGSFYITNVDFDQPVAVSTNDFYVGYELNYAAGDTVNCAMTDDLSTNGSRPNTMMYYIDASDDPLNIGQGWYQTGGDIGTAEWSMHIYPRITQTPPTAVITPPGNICEGDFVQFDGSSSPNAVNYNWAINGTNTPYPSGPNPNVAMVAAGNHWVYLQAINGCGFDHVDSLQVTVDATPNLSVTTSADTICPGNSANLSASGATSYSWTPNGSLNNGSIANPVATPATSTTYTVTGTTGNCSSAANVEVIVDDSSPTADFLVSADTICEGESINYNGAISASASSYSWTFTGGDITSSTNSNPSVTYNSAGTYSVDLTVENTCSQTDNTTGSIVVLSAAACGVGVDDIFSEFGVNAFMDEQNNQLNIRFKVDYSEEMDIRIVNAVGQEVYNQQLDAVYNGQMLEIDMSDKSAGVYLVTFRGKDSQHTVKFVR